MTGWAAFRTGGLNMPFTEPAGVGELGTWLTLRPWGPLAVEVPWFWILPCELSTRRGPPAIFLS